MNELTFGLITLLISMAGFVMGLIAITKKKAPFFFTLITFAVGCFAIEQLSLVVNIWCGIFDDVWIGALGIFASNFFLLSANYGTLDSIVHEERLPVVKVILSLIIPCLIAAFVVYDFIIWKDYSLLSAIVFSIILVPAIFASYYNMKHLLLKEDELGLLKATRKCDLLSLVFYLMTIVYLLAVTYAPILIIEITAVLLALAMLGIAWAVVKGVQSWEI